MVATSNNVLALGVCDYPEHVPASEWKTHAEQQKAMGLQYVRLAEFSWAKIEPSDGIFDWQWLDDAIETYVSQGLKIVMCTPTATPPAWLVQKYPEMLAVDAQGQTMKFGSRRHYDHACDIYRQECKRITTLMAQRYGQHTDVIGWQTDNELGHEGTAVSYGGASAERFPKWLEARYETLDALNEAWGCAFWSQDYSQWQQICPPNLTAVRQPNPSQALDYQRFCSDMIEEFQQVQIDVLRALSPHRFLTHNFVIFAQEFDLYKVAKNLDFVAWDSYPIGMLEFFATWETEQTKSEFARTGHPDLVSFNHDLYRGIKGGKDFWVMEQQCGHANWAQYNPLPAKGAVQLWTAQAWAHGASSVTYFRWRASHMAQEIMHSGLLQQDGRADRGYQEVNDFDTAQFALEKVNVRVAVLHDYNSLWAYNLQPHNKDLNYWHQFMMFYSALRELGVDVDIIHPEQLADKEYALVVAPALTIMTSKIASYLSQSAKNCPIIFGPRTAFRNDTGRVADKGQFQLIEDLVGIKLANFDSLRPTLSQSIEQSETSTEFFAKLWCESYELTDADATHTYVNGPMAGLAAVTKKDNVSVIGALSGALIKSVLNSALGEVGIETFTLPKGMRLSRRGETTLVLNFNQQDVEWSGTTYPGVSFTTLD
ncbi:Beta-galactosidase [Paraglaciecola sp. T6c]|uniref:beta-galactosidase n=1 Tax=Pseudoalteromonas atlantica (strain T6c / ATCC BAA-1087) TaxID=3042615 RepID=UPI00005C71CA|nr:beta-galactosidase [Paraglaciecola sp. T6c]ABG40662.1 Beta-galactosidase [Paraglaciecola sp. T6c]